MPRLSTSADRDATARQVAVALTLAVVAGWCIPPAAVGKASSVLGSILGFMLSGVLAGMAITASALKAGRLPAAQLRAYAAGLRRQMGFWMGLFLLGLSAAAVLAVGMACDWRLPIPRARWTPAWVPFGGGRWLVGALAMPLAMFAQRLPGFYTALLSLIGLSEAAALSESDETRERERNRIRDLADVARAPRAPRLGEVVGGAPPLDREAG